MWLKSISTKNTLFRYSLLKRKFAEQDSVSVEAQPVGAFLKFLQTEGFSFGHTDLREFCYKMQNIKETDKEYIVPVVLAKALVQPYPSKHMIMAKLPEDLENAVCVDYESGDLIEKLPTFEFHPAKEKRDLENGYVELVQYDSKKQRLIGVVHVFKDKLSNNLRGYFERGEPIGVSIGFAYTEGDPGEFNGTKYDAAQKDLLLTHLALLPPNEAIGRCPLPLCGVGIDHMDHIHDSSELNKVSLSELHHDEEKSNEKELQRIKQDLLVAKTQLQNLKNSLVKIIQFSLNQVR